MPKRKISGMLPLDASFRRVLKEERRARKLVPDALCFFDYAGVKEFILSEVRKNVDANNYIHERLLTMDIPQDNFWLRPGAVPSFKDWISYDAYAHYIGNLSDAKLNQKVYSFRFKNSGDLLPGVEQWNKFNGSFWKSFDSSCDNAYVIVTDITSYFTNINLDNLRENILALTGELPKSNRIIVDSLFNNLLKPWASASLNPNVGLPQGVVSSSILANLLLHHVDALITRTSIDYFRYADDIKIILPDKITAKKTLGNLVKALRALGLDVNASKTKLLSKEDAKKELLDPLAKDIENASKLAKSKDLSDIELAIVLLKKIFLSSFSLDDRFYHRHLSFSINRFVLLRNFVRNDKRFINRASKLLISQLDRLPGCSQEFSMFFKFFPNANAKKGIIQFLRSSDNIYNWQAMWLLDSLLRFRLMSITVDDLDFFDRLARNHTIRILCRCKAILLVGKFGDQHRIHELTALFKDEPDLLIKRSIVVACQRLSRAERDAFFRIVEADPIIKNTVSCVENLVRPKYYEEEYWRAIDIPDWGTY